MIYDFTICIPTFNRGERALELVNTILPNLKKNWSIMVLNNNSFDGTEFYDKIEELAKEHIKLKYIKHKENCQFYGNFKSCLTESNSKYILIVSDEDFVNFNEIKDILNILEKYPLLGACRTSIAPSENVKDPKNSSTYPDNFFKAGEDALKGFCFSNNYISGIIYNLENIKKTNTIDIFGKNILKHKAYPHLYFDLLVSSKFDVIITSKVAVLEGIPFFNYKDDFGNKIVEPFDHIGSYGYGERLNQFFTLRDGIIDAVNLLDDINNTDRFIIFISIYLLLVEKYFYLIGICNMPQYKKHYLEESLLKESFFYTACSGIFEYQQIEPYKEIILDALTNIYSKYK